MTKFFCFLYFARQLLCSLSWSALSDERTVHYCLIWNSVIYQYLHQAFALNFEVEFTLRLSQSVSQYVLRSEVWGMRSRYDWRSVSQYVLGSSPPWDLRPDINFVWILLRCLCWAPSLTRGWVCLSSVTVSINCPSWSFFLSFVFQSELESVSLFGWQSVSQYVLASSPLCGRLTRYCILFKCLGLGRPLWREAGSVLCKPQSSHLSVCTFTIYIFVSYNFTIYLYIYIHYTIHIIYTRPLLVPARYSRLRPIAH
jgi:hypothetical protein